MPSLKSRDYDLISILMRAGLVKSKSEARRVIEQRGVKIDGKTIQDAIYSVAPGSILQKGKLKFLEIQ